MDVRLDELADFWQKYRKGTDPAAFARLWERARPEVYRRVRSKFLRAPDADIEDVVVQAFEELLRRPESYNPSKASLISFLILIAQRRMVDLIRSRYVALVFPTDTQKFPAANVAPASSGTNTLREWGENLLAETVPDDGMGTEEEAILHALFTGVDPYHEYRQPIQDWLEKVLPDVRDRELLRLAADEGQVHTEEFAHLFDLIDEPIERQRLLLKQNRDRVLRKVRRNSNSLVDLLVSLGETVEDIG